LPDFLFGRVVRAIMLEGTMQRDARVFKLVARLASLAAAAANEALVALDDGCYKAGAMQGKRSCGDAPS